MLPESTTGLSTDKDGTGASFGHMGGDTHHNVNCINLIFFKLRVIYPHLWCYLQPNTHLLQLKLQCVRAAETVFQSRVCILSGDQFGHALVPCLSAHNRHMPRKQYHCGDKEP